MKITKLHIDNFGCLHDIDFSLSGEVNQLFNENGWGKTTLAVFIKAMLYGMPPARENVKMDRKKYMPWQGGVFGGWIEFSIAKGNFRITRRFAKTPEGDEVQMVDLKTNQQCQLPKEEIGQWIFGVGRETYEMTAFFPQLNFLSSANEQISANVLGLDKFKYDLASVGTAISNIKKEISSLKKLVVNQVDVERILKQKDALQSDLNEAQIALKQIEVQILDESRNIQLLQKNLEEIKKNRQVEENLLATKLKLDNQLKSENEKLSSLLLSLNNMQEGDKKEKRPFPWGIILFAGLFIGLAALALTNALSWIIAGIGMAILLVLVGVIIFFSKKKASSQDKDKNPGDKEALKEEIAFVQKEIVRIKDSLAGFGQIESLDNASFSHSQELVYSSKIHLERLNASKSGLKQP